MSPRTGRPTDNPKGESIHIRLDEKSSEILNQYTKQEHVTRAEAVRRGIEKLEGDIKNEVTHYPGKHRITSTHPRYFKEAKSILP